MQENRSGVGELDLVDKDVVSVSNINRQLIALGSTVGKSKVLAFKEGILIFADNRGGEVLWR